MNRANAVIVDDAAGKKPMSKASVLIIDDAAWELA